MDDIHFKFLVLDTVRSFPLGLIIKIQLKIQMDKFSNIKSIIHMLQAVKAGLVTYRRHSTLMSVRHV